MATSQGSRPREGEDPCAVPSHDDTAYGSLLSQGRPWERHAISARKSSDIAPFDLFGQLLDQVGNALKVGMHGKRAAEGVERMLVVAELLEDHAQAGQRPEMAWLALEHLLDVGDRSVEIPLHIINGRTPVPGLDVVRPDVDDGGQKLD